eukprot:NODE_278_length_11936_cov_0.473644.p2 type:complete len:335 gc:universal NODE_278_length_11936_cov_0.473644:7819-8823(+)
MTLENEPSPDSLTIQSFKSVQLQLPLTTSSTEVYIGRFPESTPSVQIQAFNLKVSKLHAIINLNGNQDGITIHCKSKNGLFVNNNYVDYEEVVSCTLKDKIFIGNSLYHFRLSKDFKQCSSIGTALVPTSDDNLTSEAHVFNKFKNSDPSSELVDVISLDKENKQKVSKSVTKSVKFTNNVESVENIPPLNSTDLPSHIPLYDANEATDFPENLIDLVIETIALSGQNHLTVSAINQAICMKFHFGNLKSQIREILQNNNFFARRTDSGVTNKMWTYLPNKDWDRERGELYSHCMSQLPSRQSKMGVKRYYFKPVSLPNEKKKKKKMNDDEYVV